jgi:hypothetical protein
MTDLNGASSAKSVNKMDGKMEKGIAWKVITITLLVIALMSATAFAYVGKPDVESKLPALSYQD